MGLRLAADLDVELFMSELDKRLDKRDQALREYFNRPHGEARQLFTAKEAQAAPIVLDLGGPAGGKLWSVQQVCCLPGSNLGASTPAPNSTFGTATAPAANGVIVNAGQVSGANWPAGLYQLTAATWYGANPSTADDMKLVAAGVATVTPLRVVPVANGAPVTRTVQFQLTASAVFQVQAIAGGAAGTNYAATLDVQPVVSAGAQSVNAGIFIGGIPSGISSGTLDTASLAAGGLTVPFNYQAGGKSLIVRQGQHLYVLLTGTGAALSQWAASATALEVPDTTEALLWL
jgi:hypothetical protein